MASNESPFADGIDPPASPEPSEEFKDPQENDAPFPDELGEDAAELLSPSSRALEAEDESGKEELGAGDSSRAMADQNGSGDAISIFDDPATETSELTRSQRPGLDPALSPNRIGAELKRIEQEVRTILDGNDPRRKRKLGGTRRWLELEDDLRRWRFTNRLDPATLERLGCLIRRRHHLFTRLRFLAGTRPVWNT